MKTKNLKIHCKYSPRADRKSKPVAEIRLQGIWLEELGFMANTTVRVSYENEKIILTPQKA